MGILSFLGFGKPPPVQGPPPAVSTNTFTEPPQGARNNSPAPYVTSEGLGTGLTGWSPHWEEDYGDPAFSNKYRLEPPPDSPPEDWYAKRNASFLARGKVEQLHGVPWLTEQYENEEALNPNLAPPKPDRITAAMSPSGYRFQVMGMPLGLREPRQLNGNHFSMASNKRAYPINGMQPVVKGRNTNRVEPQFPGNAGVTDYAPDTQPPITGYISPGAATGAFRLGG